MRVGPHHRVRRLGLCAPVVVAAWCLAGGAPAQTPGSYALPTDPQPAVQLETSPQLGRTAVIARVGGRVSYRPLGTSRSRRLTGDAIVLRFGARIDATRGRVSVTIARNRSGGTSRAEFFDGVFRLAEQETSAPYVATLTLAGRSYADVCGEDEATSARAAATKRSRKRVRRLWGDGKGRYRTRGRYSAATVRGTKWLTEDRCDGTLTRVARGEVTVEDFTETEEVPVPESTPSPVTGGGEDGGGGGAKPAPQMQDEPKRATRRKQVRVRRGGSYTAAPKA